MPLSHEHVGLKLSAKSTPSPDQNYFAHFAMRYPVISGKILKVLVNSKLRIQSKPDRKNQN